MSSTKKEEQPRKRKGRPRKSKQDRRDYTLSIYLNEKEGIELEEQIILTNYRSLSAYARDVLINGPRPQVVPNSNRLKWGELARLGSNLNQLANHLNKGNLLGAGDQRALSGLLIDTKRELVSLRQALFGLDSTFRE